MMDLLLGVCCGIASQKVILPFKYDSFYMRKNCLAHSTNFPILLFSVPRILEEHENDIRIGLRTNIAAKHSFDGRRAQGLPRPTP